MVAVRSVDDPAAERRLLALARDGLPLLLVAGALDFSFALFVMVVQAFLPDTIGGGKGTPGLALGLYGATRVLLQLPGGILARRVGAARLIVGGCALAALATLLMAATMSVAQVYGLTLLTGAGTALVWPAVYLLAGDETEEQRGTLLSLITFCALGGMGAGVVLGAALVDTAPSRAIIPGIAVVLGGAALAGVSEARRRRWRAEGGDRRPPEGAGGASAAAVAASRRVLLTLIPALTLQAIGLSMLLPLLRQYAREQLGLEVRDLILLGIPAGIVATAVFIPAGRLADRLGRGPVVAVGAAAASLGIFLLAQATGRGLFVLGAIPLAAGYAAAAPALGAWISDLSDDAGRNVGIALTVQGIALAIGPALTGILIDGHGPALPMRVAALVWLGASLCAALTVSRRPDVRVYSRPEG